MKFILLLATVLATVAPVFSQANCNQLCNSLNALDCQENQLCFYTGSQCIAKECNQLDTFQCDFCLNCEKRNCPRGFSGYLCCPVGGFQETCGGVCLPNGVILH